MTVLPGVVMKLTEMVRKATKAKFKVGERNTVKHIYYLQNVLYLLHNWQHSFPHNSDRHINAFKAIFLIVNDLI